MSRIVSQPVYFSPFVAGVNALIVFLFKHRRKRRSELFQIVCLFKFANSGSRKELLNGGSRRNSAFVGIIVLNFSKRKENCKILIH